MSPNTQNGSSEDQMAAMIALQMADYGNARQHQLSTAVDPKDRKRSTPLWNIATPKVVNRTHENQLSGWHNVQPIEGDTVLPDICGGQSHRARIQQPLSLPSQPRKSSIDPLPPKNQQRQPPPRPELSKKAQNRSPASMPRIRNKIPSRVQPPVVDPLISSWGTTDLTLHASHPSNTPNTALVAKGIPLASVAENITPKPTTVKLSTKPFTDIPPTKQPTIDFLTKPIPSDLPLKQPTEDLPKPNAIDLLTTPVTETDPLKLPIDLLTDPAPPPTPSITTPLPAAPTNLAMVTASAPVQTTNLQAQHTASLASADAFWEFQSSAAARMKPRAGFRGQTNKAAWKARNGHEMFES